MQATWRQAKAVAVFCATYFFFNALLLIDYGASLRIAEATGASGHAETLLLASIQPRVLYHAGVVLQFVCFFLLFAIAVSEIIPRKATAVDSSDSQQAAAAAT